MPRVFCSVPQLRLSCLIPVFLHGVDHSAAAVQKKKLVLLHLVSSLLITAVSLLTHRENDFSHCVLVVYQMVSAPL